MACQNIIGAISFVCVTGANIKNQTIACQVGRPIPPIKFTKLFQRKQRQIGLVFSKKNESQDDDNWYEQELEHIIIIYMVIMLTKFRLQLYSHLPNFQYKQSLILENLQQFLDHQFYKGRRTQPKQDQIANFSTDFKMIADALDSPTAHTSFGVLPLATEKTAPAFSFGTGTRDQLNRVFVSEELNGVPSKYSPGPKYDVHDNINFKQTPQFSVGKDPRITLGHPQYYDHYCIMDVFTDPIRANKYTQKSNGNVKFGTQSRMPPPMIEGTPGPQYKPPLKPEISIQPAYTLGARRKNPGGSALENLTSTPGLVRPGRYAPQRHAYTSNHPNSNRWTFGRGQRIGKIAHGASRHQTYDIKSTSCGNQANSRKKDHDCSQVQDSNQRAGQQVRHVQGYDVNPADISKDFYA